MADFTLQIEAPELSEEQLQGVARELCKSINSDSEISANIAEGATVPGTRGEPILLGTLLLAFLTSGSAVALFQVIKSYLERNAAFKFTLKRTDGEIFEVVAENLRADQVDKTIALAKRFVGEEA